MSYLPPPPGAVPESTFEGSSPRWTADAKQAKLTIPYLGAEPPSSKPTGILLMIAASVSAGLLAVRAGLYLRQAGIDSDLFGHPTTAILSQAQSGARLIDQVGLIVRLTIVVTLVLDLIWRAQRRPKQLRLDRGEAYVEFPMAWVTPMALRITWIALALGGLLASTAGSISDTTRGADYPDHRHLQAVGSVAWAAFFVCIVVWVLLVNRSHERRMAFSGPYRADPSQVPFFPAVTGSGLFGLGGGAGSGGSTSGSGSGPASGSGGIGWLLRTVGLALLFVVGLVATLGGFSELLHGHAGALLLLPAGLAMVGFVVWVMVRRARNGTL